MPPNKNDDHPGELLRLLRNLKGIKQGDAANKLGVKQQAISKLEHCKKISAKKFDKIITAFDFSEEDIQAAKKYLPPPPIAFNKVLLPAFSIATPWLSHSNAIPKPSEAMRKPSQLTPSANIVLFIFITRPCNTFPGPASVKCVAPSAIIASTLCVHRTAPVSWSIKFLFISAGSLTAFATTFW